MEALRIIQKPEDGHLRLDIILPDDAGQGEFEVIVRPLYQDKPSTKEHRLATLQKMKGSFISDYDTNKYDVYDQ